MWRRYSERIINIERIILYRYDYIILYSEILFTDGDNDIYTYQKENKHNIIIT